MDTRKPTVRTEIIPYIFYCDVPAALEWLSRAFGSTEEMRHATPTGMHAQMSLDGQRIMMGQGSREWGMLSAPRNRCSDARCVCLSCRCRCAP